MNWTRDFIPKFIRLAGALVLVAALGRFLIAAGNAQVLALPEPMLGIPLRWAVLLAGAIELAAALVCLLGKRPGLQLGWLAWVGTNYVVFWVAAQLMHCHIQGTCLGSLTDPLRLYYGNTGTVLEFFPFGLALASYVALGCWWFTSASRRPLAAQAGALAGSLKMSCPACGGHVKFAGQNLGRQIACPHCQAGITLRAPDERLKMSCVLCGGPVEFPAHALGQKIECPHCARRITLLKPAGSAGFTLIELLVVIGIIGILAGLLLPVLGKAKLRAQGVSCLSNMKQLELGAILYTHDNGDVLPVNGTVHNGGDSASGNATANPPVSAGPNWVDGVYSSSPPWNSALAEDPPGCSTNPFYLGVQGTSGGNPRVTLLGSIGGYVKAAGVYRCPADHYLDPKWQVPRVRSCSANCFVGGNGPSVNGVNGQQNGVTYKVFKKFTEFGGNLGASDCFVYLDENPLSLNDGWFLFYGNGLTINDKPAINHGMQSSFSFADGHAEYQRWRDVFLNPALTPGSSGGNDTMWLAQHGTYLTQ